MRRVYGGANYDGAATDGGCWVICFARPVFFPARNSPEWSEAMKYDPYGLRKRAFEGDALSPHEVGRAIYHLAQRRHFKGRDIDEIADDSESENQKQDAAEKRKEKEAKSERETTVKTLEQTDTTLGAWLAERGPHERKRDVHATREIVEKEFNEVWGAACTGGIQGSRS